MLQTASQVYIQMIRQSFETAGGNYNALSKRIFGGKTPKKHKDIDERIDIQEISRVWNAAHQELNDPLFALKIGETIHPSDYGIIGYLWMNCPTLLDCFNSVVEYKQLMNDAFRASYEIVGNKYVYTVSLNKLSTEDAAPFINLDISSIYYMGQFLVGSRNSKKIQFTQINICQQHDDELQKDFEEILGCPVAMGQPYNQMIIDLDILSLPVHAPNIAVQKMLQNKVERLANSHHPKQPMSNRVSDFITQNMTGKLPSSETTAKHLGVSLSTLKRTLKEEGESFQKLVDKHRFHHAEEMLKRKKLSISEISFLLGYSSPSSFTRSFKAWSGLSPHQYKKRLSTG